IERQDKDKMLYRDLEATIENNKYPPARVHALWTLHGLGVFPENAMLHCLKDDEPTVRCQALRVAESVLDDSHAVAAQILAMAKDDSPKVRHQLAFTLGAIKNAERLQALATIAAQDIADPWTQIAVLNSAGKQAASLLENCLKNPAFVERPSTA